MIFIVYLTPALSSTSTVNCPLHRTCIVTQLVSWVTTDKWMEGTCEKHFLK